MTEPSMAYLYPFVVWTADDFGRLRMADIPASLVQHLQNAYDRNQPVPWGLYWEWLVHFTPLLDDDLECIGFVLFRKPNPRSRTVTLEPTPGYKRDKPLPFDPPLGSIPYVSRETTVVPPPKPDKNGNLPPPSLFSADARTFVDDLIQRMRSCETLAEFRDWAITTTRERSFLGREDRAAVSAAADELKAQLEELES